MPKASGLIGVVQFLRRLRRRLAPAGSIRDVVVRAMCRPIIDRLPVQRRLRLIWDEGFIAKVEYLRSLGVDNFRRVPIKTIVILKLDHVGDLIVGMRALRTLREGFPDANITLVCGSWNEALAQRLGWFDRIVRFDFFTPLNRDWSGTPYDLKSLYDLVAELELGHYDLAVDFRYDPDTRPCLYRLDARYRAGFSAPAEAGLPSLDLVVPISEGLPGGASGSSSLHADLRLQVLGAAVVSAFGTQKPHPARALLMHAAEVPTGRYAVIAVGAGDPIRCWPLDRYGELGRTLIARHGLDIVIVGGPSDQADVMALAAMLRPGPVRTVVAKPLVELAPLLAGAVLCICNGSGTSHLAAAVGVPTVCLLGGTNRMEVWHPAGPNVISIGGRTPCQPCGLRYAEDCPWDVACLTVIDTDIVVNACEELLGVFGPVFFHRA